MANTSVTSGITRKELASCEIESSRIKEEIRFRAYEFYQSRGAENGHDLDGWLLAEQQVIQMILPRSTHSVRKAQVKS